MGENFDWLRKYITGIVDQWWMNSHHTTADLVNDLLGMSIGLVGRWVTVPERLPAENQDVLIYTRERHLLLVAALSPKNLPWWIVRQVTREFQQTLALEDVLFWHELPPKPEGT